MENEKKPSQFQTTLTWGIILGFVGVIYSLLLYFMGQFQNRTLGFLGIVISIVFIYLGIKAYRDQSLGGFISYGRSLGTGVLISVFAAIISTIFMVILFTSIDPGLIDTILQQSQDKMTERGMSADQIDKALEFSKKLFIPITAFSALLMNVFWGLVISLIVSIFTKKEGSPFDSAMSSIKSE